MVQRMKLNGLWSLGTEEVIVPGVHRDTTEISTETMTYRRWLDLPPGTWTHATLELAGARFGPSLAINGDQVAQAAGGMAPISLAADHADVQPEGRVELALILNGLGAIPTDDASFIPPADHWRSNVAACVWDDVSLRLHGSVAVAGVVPFYDGGAELTLRCDLDRRGDDQGPVQLVAEVFQDDRIFARTTMPCEGDQGQLVLNVSDCPWWSPEQPACLGLRLRVERAGVVLDEVTQAWGRRTFAIKGKGFVLNGAPVHLRAGSIVWHRWIRNPEGLDLGWDREWLREHVVRRLKRHGANTLRFHLGMPPQFLLDLCDEEGLLVQAEWSFFHGMNASPSSLHEQWPSWLQMCLRHPSVVLHHPWNETEGPSLDIAFAALETICETLPPLVMAHRDVCHVHKYWWSLFENIGCYYDHADQFPQPIMVDEFGGNYLDGDGELGGYKTLKESFQRFLGPDHTVPQRLRLNEEANARVAEYWRRLDAGGFSPFCLLGSWEDGNHHFMGPLVDGTPKPVWDALTAAYAPVSVSLDLWDRNFLPNQSIKVPLHLFNDTDAPQDISVALRVRSGHERDGQVVSTTQLAMQLSAFSHEIVSVDFVMPSSPGTWRLEAELCEAPLVTRPVCSSWRIQTLAPKIDAGLPAITVLGDEPELEKFLAHYDWKPTKIEQAEVVVVGRNSWQKLSQGALSDALQQASQRGARVVLLDCGPFDLGQGYGADGDLGPLQGGRRVSEPRECEVELWDGLRLRFRELGEPESCIHANEDGEVLWRHLANENTWLWNGLRGGLIVPAWALDIVGLQGDALISTWAERGADPDDIRAGCCLAYELAGMYAFAKNPDDAIRNGLRERVRFLIEDAPALAGSIDPEAEIRVVDLGRLYAESVQSGTSVRVLARCGRGLAQAPVQAIVQEEGAGAVIISQAITRGRLIPGFYHEEVPEGNPHYDLRPDPAAQQWLLNLLQYIPD